MGVQLALECVRVTTLDRPRPLARFALVVMALHALDRPKGDTPGRVYWGGQRLLALEIWGPGEYDRNSTAYKGLHRALSELQKRGLIRVYADSPGRITAYEILPSLRPG